MGAKVLKGMSLAAVLALAASRAGATVYYVRATAPFGGDGLSWATAFRFLPHALAVAGPGDEIRVGAGTYKPGTARADAFLLDGEILRGGIPPGGGPPLFVDPVANPTILSGDIGVAGDRADNSYHVVWSLGGSLNGFIISDGNADGSGAADSGDGGGVHVRGSTTIERCRIFYNRALAGGGVHFLATQDGTELVMTECTVLDNEAESGGGGMVEGGDDYLGGLRINRCSFLGNTADSDGGGVSALMDLIILNTVFAGNEAGSAGGGLYAIAFGDSDLGTVSNCTFANNYSDYFEGSGGAYLVNVALTNSILWGNAALGGELLYQQVMLHIATAEYCDTQGGTYSGDGNISVDPVFIEDLGADGLAGTLDDNLRLQLWSTCRDAGTNIHAAIPHDRDHRPRIQWSRPLGGSLTVDMGAYEHSTPILGGPGIDLGRLDPGIAR